MNDNVENIISVLVDLSVIVTLLIQECQNISLEKGHHDSVQIMQKQSVNTLATKYMIRYLGKTKKLVKTRKCVQGYKYMYAARL